MSSPKSAGAAEILRASQKDEEYLRYLRNTIADITQRCLGIPFWMKWKDFCSTLADALFYSLTTLSGLQTLGEEYANIIQVDRTFKAIPSKWIRFTDVVLRTFGYYSLLRLQTHLENQIASTSPSACDDDLTAIAHAYLPMIFKAIAVLQRIHLIAFYFYGNFYSISKRLTGIRYAVIRRWLSQPSLQSPYRVLGWIALSQLCLSFLITMYSTSVKSSKASSEEKRTDDIGEVSSKNQCSLCFEKRNHSTATPCGHLFCWACITSWMQNKEECPLCREGFTPSKLILLQNYY